MFRIKAHHPVEALRSKGFTLIELMMVVAMLAVLASLAAPSFAEAIRRHRVESLREEMLASIALAKVEAITRGQRVGLIRTAPCPNAAAATDWDCGWSVFADLNSNNAFDAGETLLHEVQGKPGTVMRRAPANDAFAIDRFGQATQPARIEIFPAGAGLTAANGLLLCVANSGRLRTLRGPIVCLPGGPI